MLTKGVPVLRDDINKALTEAMKAKNERAVSTLRMVNSTLKNADIEARGAGKPPLTDADVLPLLQKMIKQRQESVELYQKGGRADLVKQEQEEIAIISGYLPKQMSEAEMMAAIDAAVKETGAAGMKDMGKVIGVLRGKYAGQMDMAKASGMVKAQADRLISRSSPGRPGGPCPSFVITGQPGPAAGRPGCKLVPVIPFRCARPCHLNRDGRVKPGHDKREDKPGDDGLNYCNGVYRWRKR